MEDRGGDGDSLESGGQRKSGAPEQAPRTGGSRPWRGTPGLWTHFSHGYLGLIPDGKMLVSAIFLLAGGDSQLYMSLFVELEF